MKLEAAGKSDIGKKRETNQDAFGIYQNEDAGLFVVADGMGGYTDGEKASRTVVKELENWWNSFSPVLFEYDFQKMLLSIEQRVEYANEIIYTRYNQKKICGTTVVVLFVYKKCYGIVYAGDSRCYVSEHRGNSLWSGRKWRQLTVDEVWENQPERSNKERMMEDHPNRGKLVNAVGIIKSIRCRMITDMLSSDAVFLLCSDGLYKFCEDRILEKSVKKIKDKKEIEESIDELISRVYENGAKDNITILIVRCLEK